MNTPEDEIRFAEAFSELGEAAELMVEPPTVGAIRGKVRRRRATRNALATGLAAFLVAAPAAWWVQESNGRENTVPPAGESSETVTGDESSPSEEVTMTTSPESSAVDTGDGSGDALLPSFDDLVGVRMDLPSFMPDAPMVDSACVVQDAVLQDGTVPDARYETGRINLLEVVRAPLTEDGPDRAIAFLGCRFSEASAFQAVVIEPDGDDWIAERQLIVSKSNADSPYDIAAADGYGVLVGVSEYYAWCCDGVPEAVDHWIEKITLNDAGEPVSERLGEGPLPDLTIEVFAIEEDRAANRWTVSVLVVNVGDAVSETYFLSVCGDPVEIQAEFTFPDCLEAESTRIETIESLGVGEEVSFSWEVTLAPAAERVDNTYLQFSVDPDAVSASGIVLDGRFDDNSAYYAFE